MAASVTRAAQAWPAGCENSPLVSFVTLVLAVVNQRLEAEKQQRARRSGDLDEAFDFVVVGGGTAGCILAERLTRNAETRVLLLERGGTEPEHTKVPGYVSYMLVSNAFENILTTAEPQSCNGAGCMLNVPNVLGGGSSVNAFMYVRGSSVDYDDWANQTGDPGWSYDRVLPYFKRAERNLNPVIARNREYHSTSGPQRVSWQPYRHPIIPVMQAAMEDAGAAPRADINAEGQLGQQVVQTTTANGERWSTYRSYLEPALRRRNLRVVTFATATRVLFDDKDRAEEGAVPRAAGVEYRDAAGKIRVARARREVVVSAGAIHSPQLLLLSGVGPAEELQAAKVPVVADLPGVGRNLQDHPVVDAVEYACAPPLCNVGWTDHKKDLAEYLLARRGPLSAAGMLQLVTFLRSDLAEPPAAGAPAKQPDLQMAFTNTLDDNGTRCMRLDQWRFNRIKVMPALLRPRSRGSVRLNAADPQGPPAVTLGYFTDPDGHDLGVMVRGLRFGRKLQSSLREHGVRLTTSPDAGAECSLLDAESDEYLACLARTSTLSMWHWSCTCRMGREDDEEAVVNARLLVRKVRGLRVVDASVMPAVTSGNTNAPVIMIAEKAADLIREDHGIPIR